MEAAEDIVVLTVVSGETEAEIVCGLLRSDGIKCGYRDTEAIETSLEDFGAAGPREILVHRRRPRRRQVADRDRRRLSEAVSELWRASEHEPLAGDAVER